MSSTPADRRAHPRRPTSTRVTLRFGETAVSGAVRDVSISGVGLLLPKGVAVPDDLQIETHSGAVYDAVVAWRRYPHCGVAFGPMKGPPRSSRPAAPLADFRSDRMRTLVLMALCLAAAVALGYVALRLV